MVIGLVKTVLCFHLFLCVVYCYQADDHRTKKHQVTSHLADSRHKPSRYSKFDKVMTRIENLRIEDESPSKQNYRLRHKGSYHSGYYKKTTTTTTTTEASLFDLEEDNFEDYYSDGLEDYDDEEDNDENHGPWDEQNDIQGLGTPSPSSSSKAARSLPVKRLSSSKQDKWDYYGTRDREDVDDDVNYFDEDEAPWNEQNDFQGPGTPGTIPPSTTVRAVPPKPISSLTQYKWDHYGTRDRVEESRRQQLNLKPVSGESKAKAVIEHYERVSQQSKCEKPLPRVISVQSEYPNSSKIYTPACTVLYRCADDSGCCSQHSRCQFKSQVLVQLWFYTRTTGSPNHQVEKLEFYNHTECECKDKSTGKGPFKHTSLGSDVENLQRCKCPSYFQVIVDPDRGSWNPCSCDCVKGNSDCLQLKEGNEHFSLNDRMCIQQEKCTVPRCEHGNFNMEAGKCPSKKEKIEGYRKIRVQKYN